MMLISGVTTLKYTTRPSKWQDPSTSPESIVHENEGLGFVKTTCVRTALSLADFLIHFLSQSHWPLLTLQCIVKGELNACTPITPPPHLDNNNILQSKSVRRRSWPGTAERGSPCCLSSQRLYRTEPGLWWTASAGTSCTYWHSTIKTAQDRELYWQEHVHCVTNSETTWNTIWPFFILNKPLCCLWLFVPVGLCFCTPKQLHHIWVFGVIIMSISRVSKRR